MAEGSDYALFKWQFVLIDLSFIATVDSGLCFCKLAFNAVLTGVF